MHTASPSRVVASIQFLEDKNKIWVIGMVKIKMVGAFGRKIVHGEEKTGRHGWLPEKKKLKLKNELAFETCFVTV